MTNAETIAGLTIAAERLDRVLTVVGSNPDGKPWLDHLADIPPMRRRSEGATTAAPDVWCSEHEREVRRCHAAGLLCTGEVIRPNDPTGEAAILLPHPAAERVRRYANAAANAVAALERVVTDTHALLAPVVLTAQQRLDLERENAPGCEAHARAKGEDGVTPRWAEVDGVPTDCGGVLSRPTALCVACRRFVTARQRMPQVHEVVHHDNDPRGHWPTERVDPKQARISA